MVFLRWAISYGLVFFYVFFSRVFRRLFPAFLPQRTTPPALFPGKPILDCSLEKIAHSMILNKLDMDNALVLTSHTERINGTSSIKQTVSAA